MGHSREKYYCSSSSTSIPKCYDNCLKNDLNFLFIISYFNPCWTNSYQIL